ncbi:SAM-dependent methyltransferase [Planomicrobium koreense]|uniref:SAM-dependent methyltransferase n=1 Tax=Planococcus koreensis TaxID=112331 RepID=A0A7W8CVQ4_9BACL|nr:MULTISPECIES: class I SAM-dependent methyltransferase [Planococcus]MBB5181799.1 SAM-dependent methyltransferase [Planococcus koreensis]MDN3450823.1 class I SAM-dependent methyltransferase [Planococcus sp. APC 3906]
MIDVMKMITARMYMKRNEPFLSSWHAYVGYELDLFKAFGRPMSKFDVADALQLDEDLLEQWIMVGLSIGHLKEAGRGRYKIANAWKLPKPKGNNSSGVLLKEMMELHIPTLLQYPEMMREKSRSHFDEEKHAPTVAETSRLLEVLAMPKMSKKIRDNEFKQVLDIGCGEAGYIKKLAKRFPDTHFTGIEISPAVAEKAEQLTQDDANIEIVNADLWHYQPERQYDMVMLNNVIHYIDLEKREALFTELASWLEEGGIFSVVTPIAGSVDDPPFANVFNSFFSSFDNLYRLPTREELAEWGETAGLKLLGIHTVIKEGSWYIVQYSK